MNPARTFRTKEKTSLGAGASYLTARPPARSNTVQRDLKSCWDAANFFLLQDELPPLVALYDLTAGQLEHLPIRLNPFQAMIASGVLIGLAHVLSILLDPKNGNYKNSAPRTFERSGDASKRAFAAHNNGLEAFPVFVPLPRFE